MAKDLGLVMLFDFYGALLTDKQFAVMDMYYNQDFSLTEIADEMEISRQGVQAFLKQGEKNLHKYEDTLKLAARFNEIQSRISEMREIVSRMPESAEKLRLSELTEAVSEYL